MVSLCVAGTQKPLGADDVRALLATRSSAWTFVIEDTGGGPHVRRHDGLELVGATGRPTGFALVESVGGGFELALGPRRPRAPLAWVRQIWREPYRYRLGRSPFREALLAGAG